MVGTIILIAAIIYLFVSTSKKFKHLQSQIDKLQDQKWERDNAEPNKTRPPVLSPKAAAAAATADPVVTKSPPKAKKGKALPIVDAPENAAPKPAPAAPIVKTPPPPKTPDFMDRMVANFQANWVIWLAALSLAFGGIFIVQYGIENGYLGPVARVIGALAFGVALIVGAEWVRRHAREGEDGWFSVPVALAAGGVASLFAGVVSAHTLYNLTSPLIGFISMAAVAWIAMLGGIIYGPVLAVIGILGAFFSPMLVSAPETSPMMYLYFLLVLGASLFVERTQRWIWLSALAIAAALFWGYALHLSLPNDAVAPLYFAAIAVMAATIPAFGAPPKWETTRWVDVKSIVEVSHQYPTILAVVTGGIAGLAINWANTKSLDHWQVGVIALLILTALAIFATKRAQNLDQLAGIFGLGLIGAVGAIGHIPGSDLTYMYGADYHAAIRDYFPFATLSVLGSMALFFAASYWRTNGSVRPFYWNLLTATLPLLGFAFLYEKWSPAGVLNDGNWTALSLGLAAYLGAMSWLNMRIKDNLPSTDILGNAALLALGYTALITLGGEIQTIAFAALSALALLFTTRFGFFFSKFTSLAFAAITMGQLVVQPGLFWAMNAPVGQVIFLFAAVVAIFAGAFFHANKHKLGSEITQFETAGIAALAILVCILIGRSVSGQSEGMVILGLFASVGLILALVQFRRAEMADSFVRFRKILGYAYLLAGGIALFLSLTVFSPLGHHLLSRSLVTGIFPIDTVTVAYALPALIMIAHRFVKQIPVLLPRPLEIPIVAALFTWVAILEIRRFWHGTNISAHEILKPEMYSYTAAMLIATVVVFTWSIIRHDKILRKIGLGLAGLTALKVFLADTSGLEGLGRATSFIGLGLTLAGIAWLHQRFAVHDDVVAIDDAPQDDPDPEAEA
ncbi:membrane protein [Amylibacter ulvae]|uniref:Membrane protein n=1 Tax=Paramylibacter ulvae TaxID=1651968 RepID=A0ABQ3CVJ7_9RHOB|nr:DUF2339 domain-containing protein [Amylibacter ulvae]GHA43277.1 membrane protein [Amylibacter ulvae]